MLMHIMAKNEVLTSTNVLSFLGRGIIIVSGLDVVFLWSGVGVIFIKQTFI